MAVTDADVRPFFEQLIQEGRQRPNLDDRRLRDCPHTDTVFAPPAFNDLAAWERRAADLRRRILAAAGLWPEPPRTPLKAKISGRVERAGYSIERVAFQSFPGYYVTGNLYRPRGLPAGRRVPGVLNPHGHFREGRLVHNTLGNHARRAANLALQGYVAFLYDMAGYVDSRQVRHREFDTPAGWLWCAHVLGLQLWASVRALDFLAELPDVDPERLACTGESGGGTQTFLLAAVDARVKVAAPVNMISAHMQGGCACENAPGLRFGTSNMEIGALMTPRPLLLVSASGDWTANTPQLEYPAIRRIYALYGCPERVEQVPIDAPHNYNQASREAVYAFLARTLGGRPEVTALPEVQTPDEPDEVVRVFPDNQPLPPDALDEGGVRAALIERSREQFAAAWPRRAGDLPQFRSGFGQAYLDLLGLEAPSADDLTIRVVERDAAGGRSAVHGERLVIGTRAHGEQIPALLLTPPGANGRPTLLVYPTGRSDALAGTVDGSTFARLIRASNASNRDSTAPGALTHSGDSPVLAAARSGYGGSELAALLAAGRPVFLFDAFLTGNFESPLSANGRPTTSPHFYTFNRSDTAWRAQDVATAAAALRKHTGAAEIDVVAIGEGGLWALLALPVLEGVRRVAIDGAGFAWDDDEASLTRLYAPGLRRAGSYRTAVALGAPRPLLWHNTRGQIDADALTRLYALLGAPAALRLEADQLPPAAVVAWLDDASNPIGATK